MAYTFDPPLEYKRFTSFNGADKEIWEFVNNRPFWPDGLPTASWYKGLPLPAELMPKVLHMIKGDRPDHYGCAYGGIPVVSQKFKSLVDSLDPGRHQFFGISVLDKEGNPLGTPYYIFNVIGEIDSIIEKQSNLEAFGRGSIDRWCYQRREGAWKCAMDSRVINGRAFWVEHRYFLKWFISDKMVRDLKAGNIFSFSISHRCDEV